MVIIKLINNRYKLDELVYSNLYCSTYIASDLTNNNKTLVINILNSDNIESEFVNYMISDFIKITTVEHSNIQRCLRFDVIDTIDTKTIVNKQYYFATDFIDIDYSIKYINIDLLEKLNLFKELCYGMQYLHFRGITYGNLNFDKIFAYKDNGEIKLKLENIISAKLYKNIPDYNNQFLAPEFISGETYGYSSDIYSLGVILFYLITGKDYKKENFKAAFNKDLGKAYRVINKMTRFEADERYHNVQEVMDDLCEIFDIDYPFKDKKYYEILHFNLALVSRIKEKREVLDSVMTFSESFSSPSMVLMYGEAGVGKSRLLREIEFMLKIEKKKIFTIRLDQNGEDFSLFKQIIRYTLKTFSPEMDLINRYGSELVKIVPEMAGQWDINPSDPLNMEKENYRLINRVANYLVEVSKHNELIISIDNSHYLNEFDKNIIELLVSGGKAGKIIFLATESLIDDESTGLISINNNNNQHKMHHITKMNIEEMTSFVKDILGVDYPPFDFTTKLMEVANGTPKYIEEVIKCLYIKQNIYIGPEKRWKITIDNIYDLELPGSISDAIKNTIASMEEVDSKILSILSVFKSSVPLSILIKIISEDIETVTTRLNKLMKLNIITEKLGDFGYSYGFYDDRLKKYYYRIVVKEKIDAHKRVAAILEENIGDNRDYTTELIYHYVNSKNYAKAIEYSIKAGEMMEGLYINKQAIAFYEEALSLFEIIDDKERQCNILLTVASLYLKNGETEKAHQRYSQAKELAALNSLNTQYVDSLNKLSNIEMFKGDMVSAKENIHKAFKLSVKYNYVKGELEAALQQCYLLPLINEEINMDKFINKYIGISLENKMYYYTASLYNSLGMRYMKSKKFKQSMKYFLESISYFDMSGSVIDKVKPINNIGVVYIEHYRDIEKGREYFNKSLELYDNFNHSIGKPLVLGNLGELSSLEDDFASSLSYYNKALELANDIGDVHQLYMCYVSLSTLYTKMYKYDKAGYYLRKAREFRKQIIDTDEYYFDYCYAHAVYYLQIHRLEEADEWIKNIVNRVELDGESEIRTATIKLRIGVYKGVILDKEELLAILEKHKNGASVKNLREYIKHLTKYFINQDDFEEVDKLILMDNELEKKFDTPILEIKKAYILGRLNKNKIPYYKEIIAHIESEYLDEYRWRAYKLLGDEYLVKEDYYNALSNYITALDILRSITIKIPKKHRDNYIFSYYNHYNLKKIINGIRNKVLGYDIPESKSKPNNLKEFFDISDFNELFNNSVFMKSGHNEITKVSKHKFEDVYDLIDIMDQDPLTNMRHILYYCVDLCLADRGYVVINTSDSRKLISVGTKIVDCEVDAILTSTNHDGNAKFRSNRENSDLDNYFASNIKSFICIPIKRMVHNAQKIGWIADAKERRKSSNSFDELIGYLYLDTFKVFNNFTDETYGECNKIIKLLSVLINNYELKVSSSIDKLTGVYLRKYIEEVFNKQINYAQENKVNLSVVMCDIDKFKTINDTYGHQKGDVVLRKLGELFQKNMRKTDFVGRYGGEEFIFILPNTDHIGASILCDKLRKIIEESDFLNNKQKVTMSFGISTFPNHGTNEEILIEKADKALYHSKETGRNKTSVWSKELDSYTNVFDKLSGIVSGNFTTDYRKIDMIVNIMTLLSRVEDREKRLFDLMGYILELSEASTCILFELGDDNTIKSYKARQSGLASWYEGNDINTEHIKNYVDKKSGEYFIDWNNVCEQQKSGLPNWKSYIIVPLYKHGEKKGILKLSVSISDKEFDFKTFNLVNSLNGIIASML